MHGTNRRCVRGADLYEAVLANLGVSAAWNSRSGKARRNRDCLRTLARSAGPMDSCGASEAACELPIAGMIDGKLSES